MPRPLLVLLVILWSWGSAQQDPSPTFVRVFTPFNAGGDLVVGLAVTGKASGSCDTNSAATPERPDAWRCSAGNAIFDPCFQNLMGDSRTLACAKDPFSANVTLLTLTADLPDLPVMDEPTFSGLPWAVELENGQQCTLLTGATAPVAGMRINYGCDDGAQVVGNLEKTLPLRRVFYRTQNRSFSLNQVGVTTAWY
jgi:hypothetical protein